MYEYKVMLNVTRIDIDLIFETLRTTTSKESKKEDVLAIMK